MEYIISALWLALECVAFFLFASAFLPYRHNSKRTLLTALCVCILFLLNQSLVLPALVRRLCALSFGLCLIVFLFQGRLEQRIFIGLLDYILIAAMDAIVLFGASTLLRISLDELVWKKGMYTVLVTAGKILSVFLAWLITRLHPFHRLHPLRPKWMLLVSLFPLTSLFMLMALFLICRDQRDLTQPVAFFCIFLGIANVAIVYVISLIERDTEVKQQINILSQQMEIQTASILALDKAYRQQRRTTHDFQNHLCTISDLLSQKAYAESRAMRDIMELLTPFQVTPVTAMKIYQHFGPACTDILRKSPFRLCEISGFGFRRVDTIIRKSGGDPHDPVRIHGAMICALENARQHGHLYLEVNALITESLQFLNEPIPLPQMQVRRAEVEQKLQQMAEDNEIVSDGGRLYLPHIFMQEVETAAKAAAMLMESTEKIDVTLPLEQVKQKLGLHLTKRQSRGVEVAMERNLSIITGGPGTGKTTVLKAIIEVYRILHPRNRIVLAAPTGKASRRMAQSTGMLEALTLHSLLGLQGDFCSKDKQDKPLQVDFLIVDEASMVDMWLAHQLFTRLQRGTKLLLLGDVDQLESVGAGNVFAELIGSGIVPVTVLDEIFRQSKDSLIAYNAKFINEENSSLFYGPDFQFVKAENQEEAAAQIQMLYLRELQDTSIGQLQIISPYSATEKRT